jgi:hypothetical protein
VDQQQEVKEREDVIAREEGRLEKSKGKNRKQHHNWHPAILIS